MKALFFSVFSLISIALHAQCNLITPLKEEGFENLIQISEDGGLQLHYENRRYRFEGVALKRVLEIIAATPCLSNSITIIIYNKGIPISELRTQKNAIDELISGELSATTFNREANFSFTTHKRPKEKVTNSSYLKSDVAV